VDLLVAPQAVRHALPKRIQTFARDRRDRHHVLAAAGFFHEPPALFR
jgi:hypothetical protein